jgi:hypothetical protein
MVDTVSNLIPEQNRGHFVRIGIPSVEPSRRMTATKSRSCTRRPMFGPPGLDAAGRVANR